MNRKNKIKAIVALAVALAFIMPGAAAFANVETIGVTSNSENTGDIENIVEISTNSDTKTTIDTEESDPVTTTTYDIEVDDDADPGWYDATHVHTITEGINAGDTVYVYNGIYPEGDMLVDKSLNLVGESKEGVIVDSTTSTMCSFNVVQVSNVNIANFTMKNGMFGIWISYPDTDVEYINITNCISHDNLYYGILTTGSTGYMKNSVIKNCEVYNAGYYGISLGNFGGDNTISECNFHDNDYGIYMLANVFENHIYHNNFIGNNIHAYPIGGGPGAIWDDGSEGNYWDDYEEKCPGAGNDGTVWDMPYTLDTDDKDNYPLVNPWTPPQAIKYILNITIDPIEGGTVNTVPGPDEEPNLYAEGTSVELIPDAEDGYTFASWDGTDGGLVDVDNKIIMTKDMNVTATFTQLEYTLTTTMSGTGSGDINRNNPGPAYHYNDVVQLTAVPDAGSEFTQWTGAITGITNPDNVTITGNMTVDAEFTLEEYTLTISIDPIESGSSVDISPDGPYNYNDEVTLTANASAGWSFAGWSGDDVNEIVDNKIIMTRDMYITAIFTEGWESLMIFTGDLLGVDTVVFGEKGDASDDIDPMDLVKPDAPPAPYIYAYLKTDLTAPYDILWKEYRHYDIDNDEQVWDLFVETDTADETVLVTIDWDNTSLLIAEYDHIGLYNVLSGELLKDMKDFDTYEFTADSGMANYFEIRCTNNHAPIAYDDKYETMESHGLSIPLPGVLANDEDEDEGDVITADWVSGPSHASDFTLNSDGSFYYMPILGYSGPDTFTYRAYDGKLYSDIAATVTIEVKELYHIGLQYGWNLISMPVGEPIDKTNILVRYLGDDHTWDEAVLAETTILDPIFGWNAGEYNDESILVPGEGYWLWSYNACELLIPSNAIADNHITNLAVAWNLVGIPYNTSLKKTDINVYYNGDLYNWTEATTDNNPTGEPIILGSVFGWDGVYQKYELTDTFMPGYGYWMYAYHGCALKTAPQ